jgi:regulator of PEP synthase PpsR (kinase-PPPase family)
MTIHHLHLLSDATGETINTVARACLVQFEGIKTIEHVWSLVRTRGQMDKALDGIAEYPGPVLFTLVNETQRGILVEGCRRLDVPCIPVLDPIIHRLASCFGVGISGLPGLQHALDAEYFHRMDAMNYALAHDDGQLQNDLDRADVVLVGVSRTSKTPTCIYLANRGIKAANVPIVPGCPLPDRLLQTSKTLVIGLTTDPARLVQVRRNRMRMIAEGQDKTDYLDLDAVREEVSLARKYCRQHNWPLIDVTRRSIEETAATVMTLYAKHRGAGESPDESTDDSTDNS